MNMRRILTASLLMVSLIMVGQEKKAEDYIQLLQQIQSGHYKEVVEQLKSDENWTLMDELNQSDAEGNSDQTIGVNDAAYTAYADRYGMSYSNGRFLDGRDQSYDICFVEKTIRAHQLATYRMDGRKGQQLFLIVPTDGGQNLEVNIFTDGDRYASEYENGIYRIHITEPLAESDQIQLCIQNMGGETISYIIVNEHL